MSTKTEFMELLEAAHCKSGAPGDVVGFYADGRYKVKLQYGFKVFRFKTRKDGGITVFPSWSIGGCRQKRQGTAKPETEKPVKVIFRKFPLRAGVPAEVIALFPELPGTNDASTCTNYMHIGQHGAAGTNITRYTRPAKPGEYDALKKELQRIGYRLRIVSRFSPKDHETRKAAILKTGRAC